MSNYFNILHIILRQRGWVIFLEGLFAILDNIFFFRGSIDNKNSFPHPLSKEKELYYLRKYKIDKDISARDILIKHNLRLVAHIAKKYNNYKDQDELISIGSLGLIKGIESYNLEKGNKLTTYCSRCIENEILMAMRYQKKYNNVVSLYDPVGVDKDGNEMMYIDILKQDEDVVYKSVENDMVRKLLLDTMDKKLENREKQILILRYGILSNDPLTQQEVAKRLNISRSYVSRLEKRALKALRSSIDKSVL